MPHSARSTVSSRSPTKLLYRAMAFTCVLSASLPAFAQTARVPAEYRSAPRSLVTQAIDRTRLADLPGAIHPGIARAQDLGAVPDTLPLEHIQLLLRRPPERQAAFDSMVEAINHPGSPSFHQWLTPDEIGTAFGPYPADIAAVTAYLQAQGFTINRVSRSGLYLDFTGTAAQVRDAFHTEIHDFRLASAAATEPVHHAAAQPAQIPAALAPVLAGFVSLSDIPFRAQHHILPAQSQPAFRDNSGSQSVGAQDFYTIYNERPLLTAATPINGSGQTIALLEETDIVPNDVTVFRTTFGVTPATPALTIAHGSPSVACTAPGITDTNEEGEAVLDTEWAGAAAPSATLLFMACASTNSTQGIILSAEAVIEDNLAAVMSLSYGGTEIGQGPFGAFMSQLWEQAAAQGQTVVVSSGDSGSDVDSGGQSIANHGLNVNVLASTAYNISAGGTDFQDTYNVGIDPSTAFGPSAYWSGSEGPGRLTAKSYIAETTWNGSCASSLLSYRREFDPSPTALCDDPAKSMYDLAPVAASGGTSILNPRPGWQNGTVFGLPSTASYPNRLQPDISLFASNYIWGHALALYQSDRSTSIDQGGGTSFVAPQLAGVFALVAQKTNSRLGLANVQLYNLAGSQFGTTSSLGSGCNGSGTSGIGETATAPAASCVFYDIQTGNISDACTPTSPNCYTDPGQSVGLLSTSTAQALPAYTAAQGYDMATGIGSLNIANLVNNWSNTTLAGSTTKLSLSQTTFSLNTPVNFTITVAPTSGTATPTGSAALVSSTTFVYAADATLTNGTGTASTQNFPGGTYTVYARYLGDGTFAPSTSSPVTITVNPLSTTTILAAPRSASGSTYGSTVTLSATLSPLTSGIFDATGSITFYDGSTPICTAVPFNSGGVATCQSPALTVGSHTFKAVYSGDADFATSTSATRTISVVSSARVWLGNGNSTLSVFSTSGTPISPASGYTGGGLGTIPAPLGIAFDQAGNLWIANSSGGISEFAATGSPVSASPYTGAGINGPRSIAVDGLSQMWIANSNGTVSLLSNTGVALSPATGYTGPGLATPGGIAIDLSGNVWISNTSDNSVTEIIGAAAPVAPLSTAVANSTTGVRP